MLHYKTKRIKNLTKKKFLLFDSGLINNLEGKWKAEQDKLCANGEKGIWKR